MANINIYAFSDEASPDIDKQINALVRNNLSGMEIRNVDGVNVSDISTDKAREVKHKIDDSGLCIWSIGSPIGKIGIEEGFDAHLEKFKHTLEIAEILEAKNIRLFSFYIPREKSPDIYRNEVIDRLGKFTEVAKNYNITLCHENEKGIYGDIPERCLEIHKSLPEIKGIFDPANFVQCGIDTLKAWEMLRDYIRYMHIKDALADGFVVPAGMGDGNVGQIAHSFIKKGGCDFTIEPHLTVFDGLKALEREGEATKLGSYFENSDIAFDTACDSFKGLL